MDNNLQDHSLKLQQKLTQEEVVTDSGNIKIVMRGDQFVKNVFIKNEDNVALAEAFNEAIKKTQELAAKKLLELQNQ